MTYIIILHISLFAVTSTHIWGKTSRRLQFAASMQGIFAIQHTVYFSLPFNRKPSVEWSNSFKHQICKEDSHAILCTDHGKASSVCVETQEKDRQSTSFCLFEACLFCLCFYLLQVYHSRTFRSASVLGQATIPIKELYGRKKHSIINRWVALTSSSKSSHISKGYIRISMCLVLANRAVPVRLKSINQSFHKH